MRCYYTNMTTTNTTTDFAQNSAEWYAWRNKGLGASDAPAVMGVSPWTTRFQLWAEKTGTLPRPDFHPMAVKAMARGTFLEPYAREWYEKKTGLIVPAKNCTHPVYEFIRASLDGFNEKHKVMVEIKCPGKADHAKALKGKTPDKYFPQIQQQFLVSGAERCDYVSFDGKDGVIVEVLPDPVYQKQLLNELMTFWKLVETKTPPSVSKDDLMSAITQLSEIVDKVNQAFDAIQLIAENLAV